MKTLTLEAVKPEDINIKRGLVGTLGKHELEVVSCNIIVIARSCRGWVSFTWEKYKVLCTHDVTPEERLCLDTLVNRRLLSFSEGKYTPTDEFVKALKDYVL
ncbi:hypothetical protein GYA27_00260 [candidate division WWE3 bacterium]|uniref:Uncharacterized protein n=1 Tax=candidate division WWE3 bacterium TaxID=2053526 RepID=A0A7X9HGI9_UNCKA|nr:hypothetical protein [candidate division WWE3 bacterium]